MSNDDDEARANLHQIIARLQNENEAMKIALTDAGLNAISLRVAEQIENEFVFHHPGGRTQRLAKVQVLIRETVRTATQGQAAWDAWRPGSPTFAPFKPQQET